MFALPEPVLPYLVLVALALAGIICVPVTVWRTIELQRMIAPLRQASLDAFRAARRDPLTGLANRHGFVEAMSTRLAGGGAWALLVVDLDGLDQLNHTDGARVGDEVLVCLATRLRQLVPDGDLVARLSGGSFGVLLDATAGSDAMEGAALSVLRALMARVPTGSRMVDVSVSVGVALAPDHGRDEDALMRAADLALARVKQNGGAAWELFNPGIDQVARRRAQLVQDLPAAIAAGQILPYYQPIIDLQTGSIVGLEVLARWLHPARGMLAPDIFVPLAEEVRLTGAITESLLRRVVADQRDWPQQLYFAFNFSPGQLRELIALLRDPPAWPEGRLQPTRFEVELTEEALVQDIDVAREVIYLLHEQGTRVVLDNFGMGMSNFFHLRELPFDRIKIDKSFVLDIAQDKRAEACVRAMLGLGRSLDVEMVAAGLEDLETEAFVKALGCRFGQGFLYAKPVAGLAVPSLLARPARTQAAALSQAV